MINVSKLLKSTGKAYFAVRRDVVYEGFRTHKIHQKPTFQCNVTLGYKSIYKNESCEIYEYQHINQLPPQYLTNNCPFCHLEKDRELIVESATVFALFDKFPVSNGYALIIPKRHVASYFDLTFKEQSACWFVLNEVKKLIQERFNPKGFNISINIGEIGGQTVPHAHIHLIPRYEGDVENPIGGVRNIIFGKGTY